jgi:hypothetical protein
MFALRFLVNVFYGSELRRNYRKVHPMGVPKFGIARAIIPSLLMYYERLALTRPVTPFYEVCVTFGNCLTSLARFWISEIASWRNHWDRIQSIFSIFRSQEYLYSRQDTTLPTLAF